MTRPGGEATAPTNRYAEEAGQPPTPDASSTPAPRPGSRGQRSTASPLRLMWWKFTRHRLAVVGGLVILSLYGLAIFGDFISPYSPHARMGHPAAAPRWPVFPTADGVGLRPVVFPLERRLDEVTFQWTYVPDTSRPVPVEFFVRGDAYRFLGLFEADLHLFGAGEGARIYLMGTDRLGRDVFSRTVYGARVSLSIGLVGVGLSLFLGILLGGLSGYFGGLLDLGIQRFIEIIRSFPSIPLWMALAAAVPAHWSPIAVYFGITVVLSFIGWTELARVVRGRFLSLRHEDFVVAARLGGASELRVIFTHMLPSFMSHIIASITLSIPAMILAETSLSFLGIGLRPPAISWGVLLQDAQNINSIGLHPWLLLPGLFVVVTVLAFNFLGDGLRDAADPYKELSS